MSAKILIADDDTNVIVGLNYLLESEGFQVSSVTSPEALLEQIDKGQWDLLLMDMNFRLDTTSGQEGLGLLEQIREKEELLPIIMMTGWATVELAVDALKLGANDFLQKPWQDERLLHAINTQLSAAQKEQKLRRLTAENQLLKTQQHQQDGPFEAKSPVMLRCIKELQQLASSDMNLLLTGENGTGKSLLASWVHQASLRRDHSFIAVNMGAISDTLFESEIFGHIKGSFTDAKANRIGRFQLADKGTLFLDEIANIPLNQQAKLLRVLEESQFEPLGSQKTIRVDTRVISATNGDLQQLIEQGAFRQDLLYRLNTVTIRIPSLRERTEDIIPLAEHFLTAAANKYNKTKPQLTAAAQQALLSYAWPGNVRELSHLMERVLFTCSEATISAQQLGLSDNHTQAVQQNTLMTLAQAEQALLAQRLDYFDGNASEAAKSLGLSRSAWYRRMEKFDR